MRSTRSTATRLAFLQPVAVRSLYQPDAIANYRAADGRVYLVMANEGDARSDDSDVKRAGAGSSALFAPETVDPLLQRLNVSTIDTTAPTDLVGFGGRSFSIRSTGGELVYDSGKLLDQKAIDLQLYADSRSDDKGVEPEGVALARVGDRTLAFIGMERAHGQRGRDVRHHGPAAGPVHRLHRRQRRQPGLDEERRRTGRPDDRSRQDDRIYLAVSNEVSHTTTLYAISAP